jgi:putative endonuclease
MAEWIVYILRCADGTLYTGITNDAAGRLEAHNRGKGAKYTAARRPVALVYAAPAAGRSEASRIEARIKTLSRQEKLALIASASGENGPERPCATRRLRAF